MKWQYNFESLSLSCVKCFVTIKEILCLVHWDNSVDHTLKVLIIIPSVIRQDRKCVNHKQERLSKYHLLFYLRMAQDTRGILSPYSQRKFRMEEGVELHN